jgi:hypothetical protein
VFVKVNEKLLTITKTLTYYITEFIVAVKSFTIQAQGVYVVKLFRIVIYNWAK